MVGTVIRVNASLGLALLLAAPRAAPAQTFYGLSAGLNYSRSTSDGNFRTSGFAAQASVGRQFAERLGLRLDAFASWFHEQPFNSPALAFLCGGGCQAQPVYAVGVAGLTTNGLVNLVQLGQGPRLYLIAGGGAYYLYQHPSAEGAVRFGGSVGAGFAVPVRGQTQLFVEARYHELLGAPSPPRWLAPVTCGIRF